jgi:hypothetical protein
MIRKQIKNVFALRIAVGSLPLPFRGNARKVLELKKMDS